MDDRKFKRKAKLFNKGLLRHDENEKFEDYLDANPDKRLIVEGMRIDDEYFGGKEFKSTAILRMEQKRRMTISIVAASLLVTLGLYLLTLQKPVKEESNEVNTFSLFPNGINPRDSSSKQYTDSLIQQKQQK